MTKEDLHKLLAIIYAEYDLKISADRYALWWEQVKEMEFEEAMAAARHLSQQKCYGTPKFADFMESYKKLRVRPDDLETADEAWNSMFKRNQGSPRAKAAARLMHDWSNKDRWDYDTQVPWKQKEYIRIYNGLKNKDEILGIKQEMTGIENHGNEKLSHITNGLIKKLGA